MRRFFSLILSFFSLNSLREKRLRTPKCTQQNVEKKKIHSVWLVWRKYPNDHLLYSLYRQPILVGVRPTYEGANEYVKAAQTIFPFQDVWAEEETIEENSQ